MMEEFLDTYTDDLTYLRQMYDLHTSGKLPFLEILYIPFLCRSYLVCTIGSFELILSRISEKHPETKTIIDAYFRNEKNEDKIPKLFASLKAEGLSIKESTLADLVAIKHLRNALVHAKWDDNKKSYVQKRNFPCDFREFDKSHFDRLYSINQELTTLIGMISIKKTLFKKKTEKIA